MTQPPEKSPLEQLAALSEATTSTPPGSGQQTAAAGAALSAFGLDVLAGTITGVISLVKTISYAALIFSAGLSPYLATGLGMLFISNIVIRLVTAATSSFPSVICNPQSEQVVIIAFMAAAIANRFFVGTPPEILLATIIGSIALSSLLAGLVMFLLGTFRQGDLGRFLPYPITGGFLAGISWLLMVGALQLILGSSLRGWSLDRLLTSEQLYQLLAGLAFAATLLVLTRRIKRPWVMPLSFLGAIAAFYVITVSIGVSLPEIRNQGWLLELSSQGNLWQPLDLGVLQQINWTILQSQLGVMGTLIFLSTLSLLLGATNLEIALDREIDLNRELKSVGVANITSGLLGGMVGTLSLSSSLMAYNIGGRSRWVSLVGSALFALVLFFGTAALSYLPRFVLGGLLLYSGFDLLTRWLYEAWFKLPKSEYLIALSVFGAIVFTDLITGFSIGLLMAIGLFVINYSRISPSRHVLSGEHYQSNVIRPTNQTTFLSQRGRQIYILELEGFIFFGTAHSLLNQLKQIIHKSDSQLPVRFVILDFRLVKSIDFSATLSFIKLKSQAQKQGIVLLFTGLSSQLMKLLRQAGIFQVDDLNIQVFEDIDRGYEWCEETLLEEAKWRRQRFLPLSMQLTELYSEDEDINQFMGYLQKLEFSMGDVVVHQGETEKGLYFVEFGQVSSIVQISDNITKRLQTYTAGTLFGKQDLASQKVGSSSLVAEQNSQIYFLSQTAFERMEYQAPHLASTLLKFIIQSQRHQIESYEKELKSLLA
jgi:SulP family sulfate permease